MAEGLDDSRSDDLFHANSLMLMPCLIVGSELPLKKWCLSIYSQTSNWSTVNQPSRLRPELVAATAKRASSLSPAARPAGAPSSTLAPNGSAGARRGWKWLGNGWQLAHG